MRRPTKSTRGNPPCHRNTRVVYRQHTVDHAADECRRLVRVRTGEHYDFALQLWGVLAENALCTATGAALDGPSGVSEEWVEECLARWGAARAAGDFPGCDQVVVGFRDAGLDFTFDKRRIYCPPPRVSERQAGDHAARWGDNLRYDDGWGARQRALRLVSPELLLASTPGWAHAPRLMRFKAIPKRDRFDVGHRLGRDLRRSLEEGSAAVVGGAVGGALRVAAAGGTVVDEAVADEAVAGGAVAAGAVDAAAGGAAAGAAVAETLGATSGKEGTREDLAPPSSVICLEKTYIEGFAEGFCGDAPAADAPPFVLLLANGGDEPATAAMCAALTKQLPTMRACFATNLHRPANPVLFRPLPLGIPAAGDLARDDLIAAALAAAGPWCDRDPRLLVAPMTMNSRARRDFLALLSKPEYSACVRVVTGRHSLEDFLALLSAHRAVLSPPGRGYDCFRTWQTLAVGSVALVLEDDAFDARLFEGSGAAYIPAPGALTPEVLGEVLAGLQDPTGLRERCVSEDCLRIECWQREWDAAFCGQGKGEQWRPPPRHAAPAPDHNS